MTVASIALVGALILAALAVVFQVLRYVNGTLFPEIKTLTDNITELRAAHAQSQQQIALTSQQTQQNTARLNGQSSKIDTLLLAAPAPVASPVPAAPSVVVVQPPTALPAAAAPADVTAATPTDAPVAVPETPAPPTVNVTVTADQPLSADQLAAAHKALDAQAVVAAGGSA